MTAPAPTPSKAKAYVALLGSVLTVIVPLLLDVSTHLPEPWPAIIGGVIGLLTVLGVYQAPYRPAGTVLAPAAAPEPPPVTGTGYDPWR